MKWIVRVLLSIILATVGWSAPIFHKDEYAALGFTVRKNENRVAPTLWETQTFGLQAKSRVALKSRFASILGKSSYYRFVVEEETYPDSAVAARRLDSLFVRPPKMLPEDGKAFPLRKAFLAGNRVVIVRTDVAAYQPMLAPLAGALQVLADLPDTAGRKSKAGSVTRKAKADSLGEALKKAGLSGSSH